MQSNAAGDLGLLANQLTTLITLACRSFRDMPQLVRGRNVPDNYFSWFNTPNNNDRKYWNQFDVRGSPGLNCTWINGNGGAPNLRCVDDYM